MTDDLLVERLREARERVLERIAAAAQRVGRDPGEVRLVAVSKGFGAEVAGAAVAAGLTTLGENRVQEAAGKIEAVTGATWHLVGPLQSNKARRAVGLFDVVQSVDLLGLAGRPDPPPGGPPPGGPPPGPPPGEGRGGPGPR